MSMIGLLHQLDLQSHFCEVAGAKAGVGVIEMIFVLI